MPNSIENIRIMSLKCITVLGLWQKNSKGNLKTGNDLRSSTETLKFRRGPKSVWYYHVGWLMMVVSSWFLITNNYRFLPPGSFRAWPNILIRQTAWNWREMFVNVCLSWLLFCRMPFILEANIYNINSYTTWCDI